MQRNPANNWQISDVQVVCDAYGIELFKPSGGSHYKVAHSSQREILTIPAHRPIKAIYIKQLVKFVDAVKGVVQ